MFYREMPLPIQRVPARIQVWPSFHGFVPASPREIRGCIAVNPGVHRRRLRTKVAASRGLQCPGGQHRCGL